MSSDPERVVADAGRKGRPARSFAVLVAAGIFLSRVAGLIRERVFAHYLGNSAAAGAFKAALKIPNLLQNLLGEAVLSASFIPVYARLVAEGKQELAGRVAGVVASLLALVVSVVVVAGTLITPWIIDAIAPGFTGDDRLLTIRIVRILFPATGVLVLSAWCLGILNSHRRFFLPYVAPVLWNAAMIATMLLFGAKLDDPSLAVALAWGTFAGALLQLGVQLPFVFRNASHIAFGLQTTLEPVQRIFRNVGPVFIGRGVVQLSAYIDLWIASFLGTLAVSAMGYAQTLYLLPVSLFGMSVAAAELPQMSSAVGEPAEVQQALRSRLTAGLRQIAFFVVPSAVAFVLIGNFLVAAVFETGEFDRDDTQLVWYILAGSTLGLVAATMGRLINSAFYALHDTRTPLKFALVRVSLTAILGYLFAFPLRTATIALISQTMHLSLPNDPAFQLALGAVGVTAGSALAGCVEFVMLRGAMQNRIGELPRAPRFHFSIWTAAIGAGLVACLAGRFIASSVENVFGSLGPVVAAAAVCSLYGLLYVSVTMMLGVAESHSLVRRLRRT